MTVCILDNVKKKLNSDPQSAATNPGKQPIIYSNQARKPACYV